MTDLRDTPFEASRRAAEMEVDAISWPLAAAYLAFFFGVLLAAHFWPQPWWA